MKGNSIIVASPKRGVQVEGTLSGANYPGTAMQVKPSTAFVNGRPVFQYYQPNASGDPRLIAILLENYLYGGQANQQYADGDHCFVYYPLPGEDMNIIVDVPGTGTTQTEFSIGSRLIPQNTNGHFEVESTSSFVAWFMSNENLSDISTGTLEWLWATRQ